MVCERQLHTHHAAGEPCRCFPEAWHVPRAHAQGRRGLVAGRLAGQYYLQVVLASRGALPLHAHPRRPFTSRGGMGLCRGRGPGADAVTWEVAPAAFSEDEEELRGDDRRPGGQLFIMGVECFQACCASNAGLSERGRRHQAPVARSFWTTAPRRKSRRRWRGARR